MIKKYIVNFSNINELKNENSVVIVSDKIEVDSVIKYYSKARQKIKGVRFNSSLFDSLDKDAFLHSKVNYFSIYVDKIDNVEENILRYKTNRSFIELIIPVSNFSEQLLDRLSSIKRIVIEFDNSDDLDLVNDISSEIVVRRYFPYTKGIPFCLGKIDQKSELFCNINKDNVAKSNECMSCIFGKYCPYVEGSGKFNVEPILNSNGFEDVLKFLEDSDEDNINRF